MQPTFLSLIDILGTFSFAAAGAFAAMERKLDLFGVLILSFVTAIGGGTIRDVLIGDFPVAWLRHPAGIAAVLAGFGTALFFGGPLRKLERLLFLFDALGLGLFTLIGLNKADAAGLSPGLCIMLGTITGCFGGVLRDVLLNRVPLVFQKEIYASASLAGGALYVGLTRLGVAGNAAFVAGILTVFLIRVAAVRWNWTLPKVYDRA